MLRKSLCLFALLMVGAAVMLPVSTHAQTYTESVLYSFCSLANCADGEESVNLIQAADGNFYGITNQGGTKSPECPDSGCGTAFKITPGGTLTTLYNFCSLANCADGLEPSNGLVQGSDGNFYGTTTNGGANVGTSEDGNGGGTVFKLTPSGTLTTLYSFCSLANCADGASPVASLVQGADGNLYGTTVRGGSYVVSGPDGAVGGTVFKITPSGTLTTLYSFCSLGGSSCTDGDDPGGLVEGTDGNFYGTTGYGGANVGSGEFGEGGGTVFKITPSGTLNTLYSFCSQTDCPSGEGPYGLVQGGDGNFYGTTGSGGTGISQCEDGNTGCGTAFKITPGGTLTTLYSFCNLANCADGEYPTGGLVQGSDGNFYGTTLVGGITNATSCPGSCGTVFKITPSGTLTTPYSFCSQANCADGGVTQASLVQGSDGNFYGTTTIGGANISECNDGFGCGSVFKLTVSPALAAPVQVTLSESSITIGSTVTLDWHVLNATSDTMQQCYAFVRAGGGTWTGLKTATVTGGAESGNATITPTSQGSYTYALTCGGIETGLATLTVHGPPGTIGLVTNSPVYIGTTVTLDATVYGEGGGATPTGSVTFSLGSTSLGSVALSNGMADLSLETSSIAAGSYTVTATYSGDSQFPTSSTTATVVIQLYPTDNSLVISPNPVVLGQSVTLTSTVQRTITAVVPTGKVTFASGTETLGTATLSGGTAKLTITVPTNIPPGTYPVAATYSGDATDAASTSSAVVVAVQAATSTTLIITPSTVPYGSNATFTAKVSRVGTAGMPTGTMGFYGSGTLLGSATLSGGIATLTLSNNGTSLPAGVYGVTAEYLGDALDVTSESPAVTITVDAASAATSTTLSASSSIVSQNQLLTLSVTVSRINNSGTPTGTVTIYSGTTVLGVLTLVNGAATITSALTGIAPGTYPLTAQYSGDINDDPSTSPVVDVTVLATTTTTVTANPNPVPVDHTVALIAAVKQTYGTAYPTGTVTFTVGGTSVGPPQQLSNGAATLNLTDFGIAAGTYTVVATYSGDANNVASSGTASVVIQ